MASDTGRPADKPDVSTAIVRNRVPDGRRRFYGALLLFVVVAGIPMAGLPSLRHRLYDRFGALKDAFGGKIVPVVAQVGAEQIPFPEEYERLPPILPGLAIPPDRVFKAKPEAPAGEDFEPPALLTPPSRKLKVPSIQVPEGSPDEDDSSLAGSGAGTPETEGGVRYAQGETEREAYQRLLKAYPAVAGMTEGRDPKLRFRSWDAAQRGESVYWVRLRFESDENPENPENPEVEYVWRVDLQSGEVLPLSHNARAIS